MRNALNEDLPQIAKGWLSQRLSSLGFVLAFGVLFFLGTFQFLPTVFWIGSGLLVYWLTKGYFQNFLPGDVAPESRSNSLYFILVIILVTSLHQIPAVISFLYWPNVGVYVALIWQCSAMIIIALQLHYNRTILLVSLLPASSGFLFISMSIASELAGPFWQNGVLAVLVWVGFMLHVMTIVQREKVSFLRLQEIANLAEQKKRLAESKLKEKQSFLSTISHELRTPLNGIIGISEILQSIEENSSEFKKYVSALKKSSDDLLYMIDNVLTYTSTERGGMTNEPAPISVESLLQSLKDEWHPVAKEKGLYLTMINETFPKLDVSLDRAKMRQAASLLISNAIKFTAEGDVIVSASVDMSDPKQLRFVLKVGDTGPGIKKEDRQRVFQCLSQGDQSLTRTADGIGMGLSLCKELTGIMEGNMNLYCEEGGGTVFTISVPINYQADEDSADSEDFRVANEILRICSN